MMHQRLRGLAAAMRATHGESVPMHVTLATELGCSRPFVTRCFTRGWFPLDRAVQIAERYPTLDKLDLIDPKLRNKITTNA